MSNLLLFNKKQIFWKRWDRFIIEIQNSSIAGWKIFKEVFKICLISDNKWKSINPSIIFELNDEPVHNWHEASSFRIKHTSIRNDCNSSSSEGKIINSWRLVFNLHTYLTNTRRVCEWKNISTYGFVKRTNFKKIFRKNLFKFINVNQTIWFIVNTTKNLFEFLHENVENEIFISKKFIAFYKEIISDPLF